MELISSSILLFIGSSIRINRSMSDSGSKSPLAFEPKRIISTSRNMMGKLKLNKKEKQALRELKEKLTEKFPDVDIILFGAKARGDFDPESDIDLLILIEEPINSKIEEEDFYEKFADYLVKELEECTKAISLGGNRFQDKWGTPDVLGVY